MGDEIEKLGCGMPDGVSVGRAAGVEKVGLYGVATSQAATITDAVGLAATTAETFSATDDVGYVALNSVIAKLNILLSDLEDLGILASA